MANITFYTALLSRCSERGIYLQMCTQKRRTNVPCHDIAINIKQSRILIQKWRRFESRELCEIGGRRGTVPKTCKHLSILHHANFGRPQHPSIQFEPFLLGVKAYAVLFIWLWRLEHSLMDIGIKFLPRF